MGSKQVTRRHFLALSAAASARRLLAQRLPSKQVKPAKLPQFADVTAQSGIGFKHEASRTAQKYLPEAMGAGVAMFDYDNDGRLDLFFVNGAALKDPMLPGSQPDKSEPRYWNRLYHNNGDGTFSDVTEKAGVQGRGYGMGVATGDYDNDGYTDLLVTHLGGSTLYHNNGDGTFSDVTRTAGVGGSGWCTGATFIDYDRDGRLDIFVCRYVTWGFEANIYCGEHRPGYRAYCHPDQFQPISCLLFHNNGDGTFREVSQASGVHAAAGKALGVAVNDFDRDGWPDIFVANDSVAEQLFRNNHDGTFSEVALASGSAYEEDGSVFAGMGTDFADYNNDSWPDIFVNALAKQKYTLYRNQRGLFEDVTNASGLGAISLLHSGWGAKFMDYDNDGWLDLFIAQGHVMDNIELTDPALRYRESLMLMKNTQGKFHDVSSQSGAPFQALRAARGAAFGDLDNDGFIDVAINCNDGQAVILRNLGNQNHWLMLRLVGTGSNRDALGARVRLVTGQGAELYSYVSTSGSYLSASDPRAHFGLGAATTARLIEIVWPSGVQQRMESVAADQILTVHEPHRS